MDIVPACNFLAWGFLGLKIPWLENLPGNHLAWEFLGLNI